MNKSNELCVEREQCLVLEPMLDLGTLIITRRYHEQVITRLQPVLNTDEGSYNEQVIMRLQHILDTDKNIQHL